jgi:2-polyprenyl-6-methoxyphenol hydroxylase-like FAD-dependent oxidoreductase
VLGSGLAGTLAAAALARHLDRVTLVDRDLMPTGPGPRKGLPQARHAHLLWSGGARVVDLLLPGTTQRWLDAGAHRFGLPTGLVSMSAQGWLRRGPELQYVITSSRDLLDWTVREQVLADEKVSLREATGAVGLLGSAGRVTGVRLRDEQTGHTTALEADLVVDAGGRGSRARQWLAELGLPPVPEETIDSGLAYATRVFRAPPGVVKGFPIVNVQADPRMARPGQTATLLPIEGSRWLVTLSGTRGGEPPSEEGRFIDFARGMRHPVVGDLIASAEPVGPVHGSRSTANRRRYFERLARWPDGFVVLGDAVATYNPVYGHGMSVAAHSAAALRRGLERQGLRPGTTRGIQRAIARAADGAWLTATSQDVRYPGATGPRPTFSGRLLQRYLDRLMKTANDRPAATRALFDAFTLSGPMTRLAAPRAALATLRGPTRAPLSGPPLRAEELRPVTSPPTVSGEAPGPAD